MKITKMLFFAALGLWSPLCWGQSGSPRVSGNLRSEELQLEYRNLSDPSDSLTKIIACDSDRSFSFDLPDPEAAYMVKLSVPDYPRVNLSFPAMPGESAVVTGWDIYYKDRPKKLGGSGFYTRWNELGKKIDSLNVIELGIFFKSRSVSAEDRKNGMLIRLRQQFDSIDSELRGTAWNYMKEHPGDPVSIMALQYLEDEEVEDAFNLLDQSVREGVLAPYALDLVARSKEKVAKKGKQGERIKEQEKAEAPQREAADKVYASAPKKKLEAGDAFPALVFTDMEGKEFSLSSLKGKYVYIDVWATWCGPCVAEQPHLKNLEESLAGKNIAFVSISTDADRVAWEEKVKKDGLGGVQLYAGGARNAFSRFFLIYGIPRFILLDREGKVLDADMSRPSVPGTETFLRALKGL